MPQGVCDRAMSIQGDTDYHSFAIDEKPTLIAPGFEVINIQQAKIAKTEHNKSLVEFSRRAFYLNIGKLVLSALGLTAAFAAIVATGVACPILPVVLAGVYFMVVSADFLCAWHDLEAAKSGHALLPMHSDSIANLFFKIFSCCGMSRRNNLKYSSIIASVTRVSLIVVGGTSSIVKVAAMPPAVIMGITWLLNVMTLLKAGIEAYFNRKEPKEDSETEPSSQQQTNVTTLFQEEYLAALQRAEAAEGRFRSLQTLLMSSKVDNIDHGPSIFTVPTGD
ncbi:hypothetical protein [Candidatus Fukatsuia endosymbiont of Tuberolachnus salignus]|uniref:hypothetical protein n=2 Tax=Yersiniaceae TaxID=1903411 RepID=UPI00313EC92B